MIIKPLKNPTSSEPEPEPEPEPGSSTYTSMFSDDIDSSCSTPYVSAPSSPGRGAPLSGFYYSAPASPMHFVLSTCSSQNAVVCSSTTSSPPEDFDFSAVSGGGGAGAGGSMSSADELFLNGQIRPMKLSSHLQRPQMLAPLIDVEDEDEDVMNSNCRGRESTKLKLRDRSLRRRTRSMSPLRTTFQWDDDDDDADEEKAKLQNNNNNIAENKVHEIQRQQQQEQEQEQEEEVNSSDTTPCPSGSSSRSSSVGRSSKRWVFLKEFLYRSKSEGRNNGHKFWSGISFSPVKDKITSIKTEKKTVSDESVGSCSSKKGKQTAKEGKKKPLNGNVAKRRVPPSPHEIHYTANRAQAEELRKKTFLPYRQGLLGCLGFSSKSYGAMNGFARALNPVSSR